MDIQYNEEVVSQIAGHFESILQLLGEDPQREGLQKTPMQQKHCTMQLMVIE